jgi:hypothetical protein
MSNSSRKSSMCLFFIKLIISIVFFAVGYSIEKGSKEGDTFSFESISTRTTLTNADIERLTTSESGEDEQNVDLIELSTSAWSFSREGEIYNSCFYSAHQCFENEELTTSESDEEGDLNLVGFTSCGLSSETDDDLTLGCKRLKTSATSKIVRSTSDGGGKIYFDSQPQGNPYGYSLSHQSYSRCISVNTFLKKCAKSVGINTDAEAESPFFLPYLHERDDIIHVSLWERGRITDYRVYDPEHRLMNKGKFCPKDKPIGGTRKTGFYSVDGDTRIFMKEAPEASEREEAARDLYLRLFPEDRENIPLPKSKTIVMNGKIYLVAEFMEGETLEEVFRKVKENPEYGKEWVFNKKRFQQLLILCSLLRPEDLRPLNCLVRKIKGSEEWEFILIDNERCLPENEDFEFEHPQKGKIKTRVHCVLLCFHELMNFLIDIKISSDVHGIVQAWTTKYWEENRNQRQLQAQRATEDFQESASGIFYSHKRKQIILRQLQDIQKACYKTQSFSTLLWNLIPGLAGIYHIPACYPEVPSEENLLLLAYSRFYDIDRGRAGGAITPNSAYVPLKEFFGDIRHSKSFCLSEKKKKVPIFGLGKLRRQQSV